MADYLLLSTCYVLRKKPRTVVVRGFLLFYPGAELLSRLRSIIAAAGLTVVFGMGTGVAPPLWAPGIFWTMDFRL